MTKFRCFFSKNPLIDHIGVYSDTNEQSQALDQVNDKIEALEKNFTELKDIVMKRTYQNLKMDPKLLDQWNPSMLVIRRSPWTNMRLILNKVASDNIADLFPSD